MEIREALKTAVTIMDEKGRSDGDNRMLWARDWKRLRELLLTALSLSASNPDLAIGIEQNIDVVSGSLTGVKIDFL